MKAAIEQIKLVERWWLSSNVGPCSDGAWLPFFNFYNVFTMTKYVSNMHDNFK